MPRTKTTSGAQPGDDEPASMVELHSRSQLTMELIDKLAAIVGVGNFRYVAAQSEGVSANTLRYWVQLGKKELAEFDDGKRKQSEVTLRGILVSKLGISESKFHISAVKRLTGPDADPKLVWEFLKKRYGKTYSGMPGGIDDDTGEETKLDPLALVAERLKELMDR